MDVFEHYVSIIKKKKNNNNNNEKSENGSLQKNRGHTADTVWLGLYMVDTVKYNISHPWVGWHSAFI